MTGLNKIPNDVEVIINKTKGQKAVTLTWNINPVPESYTSELRM